MGVSENVGDSFSVVEINSSDDSVPDDVFHVSIDEPDYLFGFTLIGVIEFVDPFDNCVLSIVIQNQEVG